MQRSIPVLLAVVTLAAGCAHRVPETPGTDRYTQDQDTAPDYNERPDVHSMPEPEPRPEPRARWGNHSPYTVFGKTYEVLPEAEGYEAEGIASWYGSKFHGHRTSSGETFDMFEFTAAHRYLPLPAWARVTNLENGESLVVRVNDRGPFHPDREIDLSWAAAERLGIAEQGTGQVHVEVITPEPEPEPEKEPAQAIAAEPTLIPQPQAGDPPGATKAQSGYYFLQAGVFRERTSARQLQQSLGREFPWEITLKTDQQGDEPVYRVRLGPFDSETEQQRARQRIVEAGHEEPMRILP